MAAVKKKILLPAFALVLFFGLAASAVVQADESGVATNLALHRPVSNFLREDYTGTDKWTASDESFYQDYALVSSRNYTPDKLTDGGGIALSSLAYGANWKYGFEVDLGAVQSIKQLRLTWGHFGFGTIPVTNDTPDRNGNFFMQDYHIYAQVNGAWTEIAGKISAPDESVTVITLTAPIAADKLRITSGVDATGNATKPAANWIGIYELEAYSTVVFDTQTVSKITAAQFSADGGSIKVYFDKPITNNDTKTRTLLSRFTAYDKAHDAYTQQGLVTQVEEKYDEFNQYYVELFLKTAATSGSDYTVLFEDNFDGTPSHIDVIYLVQTQKADLVPTEITYDSSKLTDGTVILFDSGIRNQGGAGTGVFNIKWYVDGVQTGYGSHLAVAANTTELNGNSQYYWIAKKGTHKITFVVDADNHVAESDESNDSVSIIVNVAGNEPGGNAFTWQGYQWKPIYVIYGNDPANGYGLWHVANDYLYQDQISALHYKVVGISMATQENYEVTAVLNLRAGKEIALCGRMDDNGNGYCFVTHWGGSDSTMIGYVQNNEQNAGDIMPGKAFVVTPGIDYVMKIRFEGTTIKGKIYPVGSAEPADWTAQAIDARFTQGKVGFYSYGSMPEIKSVSVADLPDSPKPSLKSDSSVPSVPAPKPYESASAEEQALRDRIKNLEYHISQLESQVVALETRLATAVDTVLTKRLAGDILLQVEGNGEAWYVDPVTKKKFYLKDGDSAYVALNAFGLGISNANLAQIPVGIDERADKVDTDGDGLDDKLEEALGTSSTNPDTDNDGFSDGEEVKNGFDPLGSGQLGINTALANQLKGRILLQVEAHGEAWYVNPTDGKRYYMKDGALAYQIMRFLSLGITNEDLRKIAVGSLE